MARVRTVTASDVGEALEEFVKEWVENGSGLNASNKRDRFARTLEKYVDTRGKGRAETTLSAQKKRLY